MGSFLVTVALDGSAPLSLYPISLKIFNYQCVPILAHAFVTAHEAAPAARFEARSADSRSYP